MEAMNQMLKSRGTTLETDASTTTRLSQRPKPSSQRKGATFEDFGSDFGEKASGSCTSSPSRKSTKKSASSSTGVVIDFSDPESSPDELDCLPQHGSSRHNSTSPRKPKRVEKRATTGARNLSSSPSPTVVVIDHHQANPDYKPIDLTKMRISKKKAGGSSSSQTPENSQDTQPQPKDPKTGSSTSRPAPPLPRTNARAGPSFEATKAKLQPLRERTPNKDRSRPARPSTPPREPEKGAKEQDKDADKTPRPVRVAPRPVYKGNRNNIGKSQTVPDFRPGSQDKGGEKSQPLTRSQSTQEFAGIHSQLIHVSEDDSDGAKTDVTRRRANTKAQDKGKGREGPSSKADRDINPFPLLSPLSSQNAARGGSPGKGKEKASDDPFDKLLNSPSFLARNRRTTEFPELSPLSSPASKRTSPSPRAPSRAKLKLISSKGRNTVVSSSEEDEDERQLAPFPMATQVLESLRRVSPVTKRTTQDRGIEEENAAYRKKRRGDSEKISLDVDWGSDDEMFLNPAVDPKTLCPWCDEPLPSDPTPHLRALMAAAKRVSYPDDRLTNPLGLRAPLAAFVGVCQRHRFERNWIPRARKRGWPTTIDWDALSGRISRLRGHLQAIVDDVDGGFAAEASRTWRGGSRRPRKENEFWMEVVKNVRQQGSRQTAGVRGQFLHFNKTQPGYYGELGYVIIHQTLCDMFPPADFHPDATLPLTPADFISLVLVPEAAMRLIMEDLSLPRDQAIETLRESVEYGVAMFPVDEGEGEAGSNNSSAKGGGQLVVGAGEQMFMERARVRRKELEEEERMEAEEARKERAQRPKPRPRPRARSKAPSGAQTDVESVGHRSSPPGGSKAKRKAPSRASSRAPSTSRQLDEDVIALTSDTGDSDAGAPSKRRKKVTRTASAKRGDVKMHPDDGPSGTDEVEATPKPKSKPRPRPVPRSVSSTSSRCGGEGQRPDPDLGSVLASSATRDTAFVSFSHKGGPQITKAGIEITVGVTPRAKPRRSDTLAAVPLSGLSPESAEANGAGGAPQSRRPLDVMKERRAREREPAVRPTASISTRPDEWHSSLRVGNTNSSDDEESRPLPVSSPIPAEPKGPRSSVYGEQGRTDSFGWLLNSDDSQPRPDSPPNYFYQSYDN